MSSEAFLPKFRLFPSSPLLGLISLMLVAVHIVITVSTAHKVHAGHLVHKAVRVRSAVLVQFHVVRVHAVRPAITEVWVVMRGEGGVLRGWWLMMIMIVVHLLGLMMRRRGLVSHPRVVVVRIPVLPRSTHHGVQAHLIPFIR